MNPPPDVEALIYQSDPVACYGATELTVDAFVTRIGAIDCPPELVPAWFHCFAWVGLAPLPQADAASIIRPAHEGRTAFLAPGLPGTTRPVFATIHPQADLDVAQLLDRSMRITGHYDDPAAEDCHYTDGPGLEDPPETVVYGCRSVFVIVAAEPIADESSRI